MVESLTDEFRPISLIDVTVAMTSRAPAVLHGVTFTIPPGVTALVGLNGTGKTSLIETLAGYRVPRKGIIANRPLPRQIGYLPQNPALPGRVTVKQVITQSLWIHGEPRDQVAGKCERALERWDLSSIRNDRISTLSGGTRSRVSFAAVTAHDPSLLLLDEPTTGLDVQRRRSLHEMIKAQKHRSVLMTSHIAEDVRELADRLVVLAHGRVVFVGTLDEIVERAGVAHLDDAVLSIVHAHREVSA